MVPGAARLPLIVCHCLLLAFSLWCRQPHSSNCNALVTVRSKWSRLGLCGCSLAEVPAPLSALHSLTRLVLCGNPIQRWGRLRPLTRLQLQAL